MESTCKINKVIEKGGLSRNLVKTYISALRNLLRTKNKSIVIKDTDKNMGAEEDKDKTDVISECEKLIGKFRKKNKSNSSQKYKIS